MIKGRKKLFSLAASLLFIGFAGFAFYFSTQVHVFDRPTRLSGKTESIDVSYVNWACDCANFIETKYYCNNPTYKVKEEDCIYIEPSFPDLKVPEHFYAEVHFEKKIRLNGQFYLDEGIPESYELKTPEKSKKARVFRYAKIEMINK